MSVRFQRFVQGYSDAGDHIVGLLTVDSPKLAQPIYLSSMSETIFSQGRGFIGASLDFQLPTSRTDEDQILSILLPGISQQLVKLIDTHPDRLDVSLELVLRSTPDVVEVRYPPMRSRDFPIDYKTGVGTLVCERSDALRFPLVTRKHTVSSVPGAYGAIT